MMVSIDMLQCNMILPVFSRAGLPVHYHFGIRRVLLIISEPDSA